MSTVRLSPREEQIVRLLMTSAPSNKEIGEALGLSPGTVRMYISRVMQKLCDAGYPVSNRTGIAAWWLQYLETAQGPGTVRMV